ncbi:hypothetical protein KKE60_04725, partial [Patescibacteria group bacterium]|nr:hypothetical protein [Patescibacteria group bacterium]
ITDRGRHPSLFHDSHTGKNTSISDELLHCWRHNVSHNAISALAVMAGIYDCVDAGTGHKNSGSGSSCIDYDDGETIFKIWNYAKETGYISKSDSIPSKAMTWLALENKLCDKSDLIDGWKLPSGVYIQLMELLSPKEDKKQTDEPKKDTPKKTIQDKLNELTISEDQLENVTSAITFVKSELNGQLMPYKVAFIETYLKPHFSFSSKTTSEIITEMKTYFKEKKIQDKFKAHELKKQEELENKEQEDTIPEKNIEDARKIIYAGDPVKKIIETHATMHVGDEPLALALLVSIGIQSVLNSDGIHPKVSGTSGKGKSHCCKTMMHLIPNKYKFNTTLSDKVIYYMGIPDGAVVFSDDIDLSETLEGIIKRATSNFQEGDNYTTLDKNLDVKELYIPPRISWWLTSVDDDQSIQLLNRQFGGGIDESIEQDNDVYISQVGGAITGELVLPENEDIDICRYIIKDIKQQLYTVVIPYARGFEWTDKTNRRNFPIFLDIIKAFAVLRHRQRYKTEKNILIANIDDYNDAKDLYIGRAKNQGTKLTDVELKLCMALNGAGDVDYKYLQKKLGVSQGRISQIINGKKKGDSGLINKVPGFFAEQQNVKITEDTHVRKMVCSLDGFEPLSNFGTVITLKQEAIDMFYEYYPSITPVLPDKNNTPLTDITLLPKYILYTEEKKSNTLCVNENKSMCLKSEIQGNKVITPQPISKQEGNSGGNSNGILPHIPKTAQLQLMRHLQEFKNAQYRGTQTIDPNPHGMFTVGFLDAHPLLYKSQVPRVTAAIEQMNRSGWR